jgi:hypothetical protein
VASWFRAADMLRAWAEVQMSEASRLTLVTFHQTCGRDIIEKLRREVERIETTNDPGFAEDHVINAFWTAWHVHQWMWDTISDEPDLKLAVLKYRGIERYTIENRETFGAVLASRFVPLKICRMIATSSLYVHVLSTDEHATMSVASLVASENSVRSKPMITVMGRPVEARRLLMEVDDYWVTMILDCGLE